MKQLTRSLVRHAHAIAREVSATSVLFDADVVEEDDVLWNLLEDVAYRVILVSRRKVVTVPEHWADFCSILRLPDISMTRAGQIKMAMLVAAVENLVKPGDRVVCLTGVQGSNTVDTVIVLDLGTELELISSAAAEPIPKDVKPTVFERVLTLAGELAMEGREGRPVGALFVLGDSEEVLAQSRQLVINPFHGYPEEERNILDPRLEETIKEFSAIDGAYVIRGDGVILAAGRYLVPQGKSKESLPPGLGARHEAAVGITESTNAVSLSVSQSTGTVSIFRGGQMLADLQKPRSRAPGDL
jgi:DNA integrity scanning protein DisA with diadenylate cyclase activity